ncbi:hypothetical protein GCM10011505_41140 [Tistrella bauzanensis]|uniref:DUF983 domain-containing protein n=1 Tax=Tistrella bauzanensis TaxID=657419 RepID=A0ABQ1IZP9_9PROT|nr:DUF983 domain-containing protein [Tistrella bauzanensis]GGB55983.1 hypothetical protein GCM10011505_41140 [Tistrella bauzanensis]
MSGQDDVVWTNARTEDDDAPVKGPGLWRAMRRGLARRCPRCGEAPAFNGYLSVRDHCSHCGENLGSYRADDAPPYFTIFLVGHIVIPLMLWVEKAWAPDIWVHAALWVPLSLVLTLATLPYIKGAVLGLMLQLRIH